jgi:hypothetical protein
MPALLDAVVQSRRLEPAEGKLLSLHRGLKALNRLCLLAAYVGCVAVLLGGVALSWRPQFGFTSLICFGSKFEGRRLDALKEIPHAVVPNSAGYDGQFYAQMALTPALNDPQLNSALDLACYRSRRILFSWTAWLLGLGQPAWVIQAYALQNVLFWLGAAVLLLYWLPPTRWFHFFQWAAILFSRGWLDSVGFALLDGPALFLMLLAVWFSERGRSRWSSALIGISMLGKETNLIGGLAILPELCSNARGKKDLIGRALVLTLPIALWLAVVSFEFGLGGSAGRGGKANFALPLAGWFYKFEELRQSLNGRGWTLTMAATAFCLLSAIAQFAYYATARQWQSKWWRIGAAYALLGLCLGPLVVEGYPGAYTRALLPMLAAFNLSLKPTRWGWLLLVVGNLGMIPDDQSPLLVPMARALIRTCAAGLGA